MVVVNLRAKPAACCQLHAALAAEPVEDCQLHADGCRCILPILFLW